MPQWRNIAKYGHTVDHSVVDDAEGEETDVRSLIDRVRVRLVDRILI